VTAAAVSNINNALQTIWPQSKLADSLFEESPTLGLMPKSDGFTEEDMLVVFNTAPIGGRSATFSRAVANKNPSAFHRVRISRVKDYSLFEIETEALRAAKQKGGKGLLDILKKESKNAVYAFNRSAAVGVFGSGSGSIGVIASGGGTDTLTLSNIADIVNFEEGMTLDSDTVDGGGTVAGFTKTVGRVDYDAGTITTDDATNWNSAGGFGDGDYLFVDGDYDAKMLGLGAWLPLTVSSSDAFGDSSLNRSINRVRLAGVPYTATLAGDGTLMRTFTSFISKLYRIGRRTKPDVIICNSIRFNQLVLELGNATTYERMVGKGMDGKDAAFGYETIKLATSHGFVNIVEDANCPVDLAYALKLDTWKLKHLGGFPSWLDDDGNHGLRTTSDSIEWRLGAYFNMYTDSPVNNGVCDLSALPT
jgi:hypothetical protein